MCSLEIWFQFHLEFKKNDQDVIQLEKLYDDAQDNQTNFNTPDMTQLIKEYERFCRPKLDIKPFQKDNHI